MVQLVRSGSVCSLPQPVVMLCLLLRELPGSNATRLCPR